MHAASNQGVALGEGKAVADAARQQSAGAGVRGASGGFALAREPVIFEVSAQEASALWYVIQLAALDRGLGVG